MRITPRECQCAVLLSRGYKLLEVADELKISRFTVLAHLRNARERLELRTTTQLVAMVAVQRERDRNERQQHGSQMAVGIETPPRES